MEHNEFETRRKNKKNFRWILKFEYLYIKKTNEDLKKYIKTTIKEYLNENIQLVGYRNDKDFEKWLSEEY